MENIRLKYSGSIFIILMGMLFSCSPDPQKVKELTYIKDWPDEMLEDVEILYSDSAIRKVKVQGGVLFRYHSSENREEGNESDEKDQGYEVLDKGVKVSFYYPDGKIGTRLHAEKAEHLLNENRWVAKGNVRVINENGDTLLTEELVWEEKDERIHTDKPVQVNSPERVLFGDGLEADQTFSNYVIKKPRGEGIIRDE